MGTPSTGALSKLAFDTALPFDTGSKQLEFMTCSLAKAGQILDTEGIRGERQYHNDRTRKGPYTVSGQLVLPASPVALDLLLPMILGAAEVTDVFDIANTLQQFYLMLDSGAKVTTWSGVIVSRATFRASQGQPLMLTLDLEAETESIGNAGTFPVLTAPVDSPWIMSDGVITLQGAARDVGEIEVVIDNQLQTDRFQNALTRADFPSSGVMVTLNTDHPWTSDETALYDQAIYGAAGSLVFTNADTAGNVLTMDFGRLQAPAAHPQIGGRGETRLGLQMVARKTGTTPALRITNLNSYD